MQQVIEEILKTEEDCARRLEEAKKALQGRKSEIDTENTERVRAFREQAEAKSAEKIKLAQQRLKQESDEAIIGSRKKAEQELDKNQVLVDRIVDRIVDLVTGTMLEE